MKIKWLAYFAGFLIMLLLSGCILEGWLPVSSDIDSGNELPLESEEPTAENGHTTSLEDDDIVLSVGIYGAPCVYLFTVTQGGMYEATRGEGRRYRMPLELDLSNIAGEIIYEHESRQLTLSQLETVLGMADEIERNREELEYIDSTHLWIIYIYYKETFYMCNYVLPSIFPFSEVPVHLVQDLVHQLRAFSSLEAPEPMYPVPEHMIPDD